MSNLHQQLIELRERVIHDKHYRFIGICGNVDDIIPTKLLRKWPKFSGYNLFPVPAPRWFVFRGDAQKKYLQSHDKWSGRYGKLRLELVDWLINETAKDME